MALHFFCTSTVDPRMSEISNLANDGTTVLSDFTYQYNAVGDITNWVQTQGTNPQQNASYAYDGSDRLTGVTLATPVTGIPTVTSYVYDKADNRLSEQRDNLVMQGSFNNLNQLTGLSGGGIIPIQGTVSKPANVAVNGKASSLETNIAPYVFTYNLPVTPGTNSVSITALDGSGNASTNNYQIVVPSAATSSPTYDADGNVLSGSQFGNRYMFSGREYDAVTALYHFRNREYSPALGRFLQPDPIGHAGDYASLYRFCGNDPVNNGDPSGLDDTNGNGGNSFNSGNSFLGSTTTNVGWNGGISGSNANDGISFVESNTSDNWTIDSGTSFDSSFASGPGDYAFVTGTPIVGVLPNPEKDSNKAFLIRLQAGVTTLGLVPGPVGEASNVVGGLLSLVQGDYYGAGLSLGAIIPILGEAGDIAKLARLKSEAQGITNTAEAVRAAGKFDTTVQSLEDAKALAREAFPNASELPEAVEGLPYPGSSGAKTWFQVHPAEDGIVNAEGQSLPHVKYADWSGGKKGKGGSWGHIFFTPKQ